MGLFSKSTDALPPELDAVMCCGPDSRKYLTQSVSKNLEGLRATLQPGEAVEMLTFGDGIGEVGVMTSTRAFSMKKGKVTEGPFAWGEIDAVKAGTIPRNGGTHVVWLMTAAFRLDYREDDPRRWSQVVRFTTQFPPAAESMLECVARLRAG